jgi:hypothetical protein
MAATAVLAMAAVGAVAAGHHDSCLDHHKFNPHPQEIYEIILTAHDAPGPLEQGGGDVFYKVDTQSASHDNTTDSAVYHSGPEKFERVGKTGGNTYKMFVPRDLLVDEDYFGQGVCHWIMEDDIEMSVGRGFDSSNFANLVNFDIKINLSNIKAGRTVNV